MMAFGQAEQLYASAAEGIGDTIAEAQQEIGAAPAKRTSRRRGSERGCLGTPRFCIMWATAEPTSRAAVAVSTRWARFP